MRALDMSSSLEIFQPRRFRNGKAPTAREERQIGCQLFGAFF